MLNAINDVSIVSKDLDSTDCVTIADQVVALLRSKDLKAAASTRPHLLRKKSIWCSDTMDSKGSLGRDYILNRSDMV